MSKNSIFGLSKHFPVFSSISQLNIFHCHLKFYKEHNNLNCKKEENICNGFIIIITHVTIHFLLFSVIYIPLYSDMLYHFAIKTKQYLMLYSHYPIKGRINLKKCSLEYSSPCASTNIFNGILKLSTQLKIEYYFKIASIFGR